MKHESSPERERLRDADEPPPFGGSWGRLYATVLGWLALLILLFYWFSRRFAP